MGALRSSNSGETFRFNEFRSRFVRGKWTQFGTPDPPGQSWNAIDLNELETRFFRSNRNKVRTPDPPG